MRRDPLVRPRHPRYYLPPPPPPPPPSHPYPCPPAPLHTACSALLSIACIFGTTFSFYFSFSRPHITSLSFFVSSSYRIVSLACLLTYLLVPKLDLSASSRAWSFARLIIDPYLRHRAG
ncbi:hypothetical protein B0H10DRAFT_2054423 [Mycena sp. CBHHK59/15]|nr:hypothetical protein B0H10DRAFT_2054423 [Mycena sp. CBHHK59/15]